MNAAKFPLDLTDLSVFRALKEPLGGAERALHFFWLLWRDLAQLSQEGAPLGRMKPANVSAFLCLLVEKGLFGDLMAAADFWEKQVVGGLMLRDGEEVTCPRFITLNADLALKPRESRGGHGRAFALKQAKFERGLIQEGLKLPSTCFVFADGTAMPPELVQRVQRLIVSCDNALKRDRPPIGWTEGLVTLANQVVQKFTDEQIQWVCKKVALNYDHAVMNGMTTERLLPKFDTVVRDIGEE